MTMKCAAPIPTATGSLCLYMGMTRQLSMRLSLRKRRRKPRPTGETDDCRVAAMLHRRTVSCWLTSLSRVL